VIESNDEDSETPSPLYDDKGKKEIAFDELYQEKPQNPTVKTAFDIKYEFDDVPSARQVIHRQTILVQNRVNFEVELSFDKNKFFILVKRSNLIPKKGV